MPPIDIPPTQPLFDMPSPDFGLLYAGIILLTIIAMGSLLALIVVVNLKLKELTEEKRRLLEKQKQEKQADE